MSKTLIKPKIYPMMILAGIEFVSVAILSAVFEVEFYNALPLLISAIIMFMQTRVNRYAFLIGSINSLIYALAYFYMKLYGSMLSALLFSFPLQIVTFLNWQKHTHKGTTEIKRFSNKGRIYLFSAMAVIWIAMYIGFSAVGSSYVIWDNSVLVIGTAGTVLCTLRYSEYAILNVISSVINVVLFACMSADDITKIIWLIYSVYCVICLAVTFKKTHNGIRREK